MCLLTKIAVLVILFMYCFLILKLLSGIVLGKIEYIDCTTYKYLETYRVMNGFCEVFMCRH